MRRAVAVAGALLAAGCHEAAPGLVPSECPGAPTAITAGGPWPVWHGVVTLGFQISPDTADAFDVEHLVPGFGYGYTPTGAGFLGGPLQDPAGAYTLAVSPDPAPLPLVDAPATFRIRSRLWGCGPSAWAEAPPLDLHAPFAGTTFRLTIAPPDVSLHFTVSVPKVKYALAAGQPVVHELVFDPDGTLHETFSFGIRADTPGAPYDGCSARLAYTSRWRTTGSFPYTSVVTGSRVPAADPTAGSTCANPSPDTWNVATHPGQNAMSGLDMYITYQKPIQILADPGWKPTFDAYLLANSTYQIFDGLSTSTLQTGGSFTVVSTSPEHYEEP